MLYETTGESEKKYKRVKCSGSLCSNTRVIHRPETPSPEFQKKRAVISSSSENDETSSRSRKTPLHEINGVVSTSSSAIDGSFKVTPLRRLSGCYECRMVVDPLLGIAKDPSLKNSICSCHECGQIFMKAENLELHLAVKHAGTPHHLLWLHNLNLKGVLFSFFSHVLVLKLLQ